MRRFLKTFVIVLMIAICSLSSVLSASAAEGYARKAMKDAYSSTWYDCSFWAKSNFWDVWWGANGTSTTCWMGTSPYNADSIVHQDVLTCSGIGSMDISADTSKTVGVSCSVSGHTATYTYSVSNDWRIDVDFSYKHTGLLGVWNMSMDTKATIQFGSSFYSWGT